MIKHSFLYIVFLPLVALGQLVQTARYEVPTVDEGLGYNVLPWSKHGMILYNRVVNLKTDVLQLIKLDSALKEYEISSIPVSKQLTLAFAKSYRDRAYFLFKPRGFYGDFQLLSIGVDSSTNVVYTIKNVIPFNPTLFEIGRSTLVIAGYFNYRPVAIHYSMLTGLSKLLPGFFNEPGELNQLVLNDDETIDVVINMTNVERKKSLWIMNFSSEGNSIKNTIIHPAIDKNLIFGRTMKVPGDSTVVAGVYGKNPEYSRGVFVASVNAAGEYTVRYYNFAELRNFFKYMRVARQMRIKERIERKKVKGKKIRFNYRIAVHEFVPYQDHFLLLGEAFYPVYKSASYGTVRQYNFYRQFYMPSTWQRDLIFDGYRYTHAVVLGIAKDGRLLWDNSFEIKEVKSFTLDQYVHRLPGENLNLAYSFENKLYSKEVKGTEVVEEKSVGEAIGKFDGDKIRKNSTVNQRLEYWYGKYLISYGIQEIENTKVSGVPLVRRVFFVDKITSRK